MDNSGRQKADDGVSHPTMEIIAPLPFGSHTPYQDHPRVDSVSRRNAMGVMAQQFGAICRSVRKTQMPPQDGR